MFNFWDFDVWGWVLLFGILLGSLLVGNIFKDSPCGSAGKASTCNAGDLGSIPELGRSPGEGKGYSSILAWRILSTV